MHSLTVPEQSHSAITFFSYLLGAPMNINGGLASMMSSMLGRNPNSKRLPILLADGTSPPFGTVLF